VLCVGDSFAATAQGVLECELAVRGGSAAVVVVVIGDGDEWERGRVGALTAGCPRVFMQHVRTVLHYAADRQNGASSIAYMSSLLNSSRAIQKAEDHARGLV